MIAQLEAASDTVKFKNLFRDLCSSAGGNLQPVLGLTSNDHKCLVECRNSHWSTARSLDGILAHLGTPNRKGAAHGRNP